MVLVDSSIWIEASRRQGDLGCKLALEALLEEYEAGICPPVLLEVLGGARRSDRGRWETAFSILPFCPLGPEIWQGAVENAWRLRDAGETVPWNDLLVGTLARELGCRVYARDRHFEVMREKIGVCLYEPGYGGSYAPEPTTC